MTSTGRLSQRLLVAGAALVVVMVTVLAVMRLSEDSSNGAERAAPASPGGSSAEAGFSRDMAVHHQQAVEMSFIVRDRTDDEDVRRLAYDIANTQATQRGMMLGWLDLWGLDITSSDPPMTWMGHESMYKAHDGSLMPGMATKTDLDRLRKADGRAAEVLYLKLMTAHHKGGVDMAEGAVDMAEDGDVKRLAGMMVQGQQSELELMAGMLKERESRT